jgi:hypothetical protein
MKDTGFSSKAAIAGALAWLFERGAIYNVPPKFRVNREAGLPMQKYVFQLTGIINLDGWVQYLYFKNLEEVEDMIQEWKSIGWECPVSAEFYIGSQSEPNIGSQSERSQSERKDSISPKDTPIVTSPARARDITSVDFDQLFPGNAPKPNEIVGKFDHEMIQFFMDKTGLKSLTKTLLRLFEADIERRTDEGVLRLPGGLLALWDTRPGFQEFCKERVASCLAWSQPMTPENILKHLRNLDKSDGKVKGFNLWIAEHPDLARQRDAIAGYGEPIQGPELMI